MKKAFYIGCVAGGVLGVTVALSMDLLLGGAVGGGWREAVAHDLGALFGRPFEENSFLVIVCVIAVVGFIGLFGALAGGMFGVMTARFLSFLTKGDE